MRIKKSSSIRDIFNYVLSTLHLRSNSRTGVITEITSPPVLAPDRFLYRASGSYTDDELWEIGWHDAQWNSKPNPRFVNSVPYLKGWDEASAK